MNKSAVSLLAGLILAVGLWSVPPRPASAARLVSFTVTGKVTAVSAGGQITINGHAYLLATGTSAASQSSTVHVGDTVDLILNGPPTNSTTQVVAINVHNGQ